jgi:hypothetical protein
MDLSGALQLIKTRSGWNGDVLADDWVEVSHT